MSLSGRCLLYSVQSFQILNALAEIPLHFLSPGVAIKLCLDKRSSIFVTREPVQPTEIIDPLAHVESSSIPMTYIRPVREHLGLELEICNCLVALGYSIAPEL